MFMRGGRGYSNAAQGPSDSVMISRLDLLANWVRKKQLVADAVRHGLLRHRVDGHRRSRYDIARFSARGHAATAAAVRPDDRRRPRCCENAASLCSASGRKCRSRNGAFRWPLVRPAAASSTLTPSFRALTVSFRWTLTFPAARRGLNSCCNRGVGLTRQDRPYWYRYPARIRGPDQDRWAERGAAGTPAWGTTGGAR